MMSQRELKTISIIGAGFMGRWIAQANLMAGFDQISLYDTSTERAERTVGDIRRAIAKLAERGNLGGKNPESLYQRLSIAPTIETAVAGADCIIEAAPELLSVKQDIVMRASSAAPNHAIFATNTSSLSIADIAAASVRPADVIGIHFFPHVIDMRLIEVIRAADSSRRAFETGIALANRLPCLAGERMVLALEKESPGFVVNRILITFALYFLWALDQADARGIPFERIDADCSPLMPFGPCEMFDYLGLDVSYNVIQCYAKSVSPDFTPGTVLGRLYAQGDFGRKTGRGFYLWPQGKSPVVDKSVRAGLMDVETIRAIQLNESCRLIESGIIHDKKQIDDAVGVALFLPPVFPDGKQRRAAWSDALRKLADTTGKQYFKPCALMENGDF